MNLQEAISLLTASNAQAIKAKAEIISKIAELQQSISVLTEQMGNAVLSDEQVTAVSNVVAAVQALDDIVPDAVVEPPAEPTA